MVEVDGVQYAYNSRPTTLEAWFSMDTWSIMMKFKK